MTREPSGSDEANAAYESLEVSSDGRARMRLGVLLVLAGVAAYAIVRILAPFTLAIVGSGVVAVLVHPAHKRLATRIRSDSASALLLSTGVFLLVFAPLAALALLMFNDIDANVAVVTGQVEGFVSQRGRLWEWLASTASLVGVGEEGLSDAIQDQLSQLGGLLAGRTVGVLSGLGGWLVQGGIALFSTFYLLRDGPNFVHAARWLIPLEEELVDTIVDKTHDVIVATVLGTLVVAIVQGLLGGVLFWLLSLPAAPLWGTVMALFALFPAIGPPIVWVPAAILLALSGQIAKAAILVVAGALVVGTVDNVLRSILVGGRARLHSLVVFFSVLGGLVLFGAAGFLLGPILFVTAATVLEIAQLALRGGEPDRALPDRGMVLGRLTD